MLKYYSLRIADVYPETEHATTVVFDIPPELRDTFRYVQGQHLSCRIKVNDEEVRRTYSLCNAPQEGVWRVTIKHVADGAFSSFAKHELKPGASIEVMPPNGRFYTQLDPLQQKQYVAFAAGSGITPVLSNLRAVLSTEPKSHFTLFYGNSTVDSILFNEELQDLKNQYIERFSLHNVLSQEKRDLELYSGKLDADRVKVLLETFFPNINQVDEFLVCGPGTMVKDLSDLLKGLDVSPDRIHAERFGVPRKKSPAKPEQPDTRVAKAEVSVIMDGDKRSFKVYADDTLLDAAAKQGLNLPYSCKAGVCSTCRTKLVQGQVAMDTNHALEPWELEQGYILACQSRAKTEQLELDYDQ